MYFPLEMVQNSIVETCYQLSSKKAGRSERDKLDRRRPAKLTILPSSTGVVSLSQRS